MKTGIGFDIHKLKEKRKFILGGIEIPYPKGPIGHSDGDVLLHSVSDAILGALGKPDIGVYFPDTDEKIKGIKSTEILKKVIKIMGKEWKINNVDIIIICEKPKISPYYEKIRENLSKLLKLKKENIGIKAKTFEKIGEIGKGNSVASFSIVSLKRTKQKRRKNE